MSRLSALDASFLHQERDGAHLHVGAVLICDGDAPPRDELAEHLRSRLERVPRYRQRLAHPPLRLGKPYWVDDPSFELDYHLRYTALPSPGGEAELRRLAGRIFSQRLDRSKPLWELWVVEGLQDDRFALINKTHHAVVDGVSGVDVTTALFDLEPDAGEPAEPDGWAAAPPPSGAALARRVVIDAAATPLMMPGKTASMLRSPGRAVTAARAALGGVGEIAGLLASGSPRSPVNGPISSHRDLAWIDVELAELKAIKNGLGGTVNDAFLAIVAGALARWLRDRGEDPARIDLRACVPVSVRDDSQRGALGNRIVAMFTPLPLDVVDPTERMRSVSREMRGLKESRQAVGADAIAAVQELAPPTILAQASRLQFSNRLYNLLLSNVPGPQFPVYVLGRELRSFVPVAFLSPDKRIAVAIVSYNGRAAFSVIADRDHVHDLDDLLAGVRESLDELLAAAQEARP